MDDALRVKMDTQIVSIFSLAMRHEPRDVPGLKNPEFSRSMVD
jgi:hypothetical protein